MRVRNESKVSWVTFSMISSLNGFANQSQKERSKNRSKVREVMSSSETLSTVGLQIQGRVKIKGG